MIDENNYKKREHYVPKSYLKQFAENGFVYVLFSEDNRLIRIAIDNLCVSKNLYESKYYCENTQSYSFISRNYFENSFVSDEGIYATKIKELIELCSYDTVNLVLPKRDIYFFARFCSQLMMRNPIIITADKFFSDTHLYDNICEYKDNNPELCVCKKKQSAMNHFSYLKLILDNGSASMINSFERMLREDNFCILKSKGNSFITTDVPVVNIFSENNECFDIIGMPITPNLFLAFVSDMPCVEGKIVNLNNNDVDYINNYQIGRKAVKMIIAKEKRSIDCNNV